LENPSVLPHNLGNKHFPESGRGKKGFRNPRKLSIAHALPWHFLRSLLFSGRIGIVPLIPPDDESQV
jgi:hypothetical protein